MQIFKQFETPTHSVVPVPDLRGMVDRHPQKLEDLCESKAGSSGSEGSVRRGQWTAATNGCVNITYIADRTLVSESLAFRVEQNPPCELVRHHRCANNIKY